MVVYSIIRSKTNLFYDNNIMPAYRSSRKTKTLDKTYQEVVCYAKSGPWSEFQNLGKAPKNFNQLVRLLSLRFFPYNFSVNFFDKEKMKLQAIGNHIVYDKIIRNIKRNNLKELHLIVYLSRNEKVNRLKLEIKEEEKLTENVNVLSNKGL